jgi:hypothetical protein
MIDGWVPELLPRVMPSFSFTLVLKDEDRPDVPLPPPESFVFRPQTWPPARSSSQVKT